MTIKLKSGNGPVIRAATKADTNASVRHDYVTVRTSGGSFSSETLQDANFNSYTGATYHREGDVEPVGMGSPEIINLDPAVGTVDSEGRLTRLSSGIMRLLIRNNIITLPLIIDMSDKSDEPDQPLVFVSTVTGSLAEHVQQQVDNRLAAIAGTPTMAANGLVFTSQNHATQSYVRNPDLWCSQGTPIDLTCISPWNSSGGAKKAGTLITPRHIISAAHYEKIIGNTVRFVAQDGAVHNRTITGKQRHPAYTPYYLDLTVYTLSSDLPAAISPCKLMPANWNSYLVQNFHNRPPALGLDQEEKALIIDFHLNGSFHTPVDSDRFIFHENKISGDSGNPAFLIVNDELVLVTVWTFGGAGSGTPVSDYIPALNQMIVAADTQAGVSTGYTVTTADFSAFPNYA